MGQIPIPAGEKPAQDEVIRRISSQSGSVAHLRALLVWRDGVWLPACGRIDVARRADSPPIVARPIRGARLLTETISIDTLVERLIAAFAGAPLIIDGASVAGHGMDGSGWFGMSHTRSWNEYGVSWPVLELAPMKTVSQPIAAHEAFVATGERDALAGLVECLQYAMGYPTAKELDSRGSRFGIYIWDYRGVFRQGSDPGSIHFVVEPENDTALTLAIVFRDDRGVTSHAIHKPEAVNFPLTGQLHKLNMTLRHNDDVICEVLWAEENELFRLKHDGVYFPAPLTPAADPIDIPSAVAEAALPFIASATLARLVARDLGELDNAVRFANIKSAILLAGSVLEAVLLDVLGRNEGIARNLLGKKWPERASASDLINAASTITVVLPDTSTRPLLPPLTQKKGGVLIDHRDLIHPRAEVRGGATIDISTVQTMSGVLGEVLRDLHKAHSDGVLDAYQSGAVV